jgi:transcriptional regulator NrdR family protein
MEKREELGIACPKCYGLRWTVYRTRGKAGQIVRERVCLSCGRKILTVEKPAC